MLHRAAPDGIFVISQPAHSWVSGRLARAWGNDLFGELQPREEIILAAALHDLGFLEWEQAPTLNIETGWPHTFMDLPTPLHLELWSKGIQEMVHLNRYAALLVSFHYTGLTERHPAEPEAEVQLQQKFLADQRTFQTALLNDLRADPSYAPFCEPALVEKNRRFIPIWDWMSLIMGMGKTETIQIENVPTAHGSTPITLSPQANDRTTIQVSPWPFAKVREGKRLQVSFEARHLPHKFQDQQMLRRDIETAPVQVITITLVG